MTNLNRALLAVIYWWIEEPTATGKPGVKRVSEAAFSFVQNLIILAGVRIAYKQFRAASSAAALLGLINVTLSICLVNLLIYYFVRLLGPVVLRAENAVIPTRKLAAGNIMGVAALMVSALIASLVLNQAFTTLIDQAAAALLPIKAGG